MNTCPASVLESLEPRLAPAGVVLLSTAGGVLTMTGDIANNSAQVTSTAPGQWEISDHMADGTLFSLNGAPAAASVTLFATQSIKATLNGGDDQIEFKDLQVNGNVNVMGNDGNDALTFDGSVVNGATTADLGNGHDTITAGGVFNGLVTLKTGKGADGITFGDTFLGRGLTADLGADANTFSINAAEFQSFGAIAVAASGTAIDTQGFSIGATDGFIAGALTIKSANGTNNMILGGATANDSLAVTGNVTLQTGAGLDSFTLQQSLIVGGTLSIAAGNAVNTVTTDDLANFRLGAFTYAGGTGDDTVALKGTSGVIGGSVSINGGAGVNQLDLTTATSLQIGGGLAYTGGAADDTVTISGASTVIGGQLNFKVGDGNNELDVKPVTGSVGSISFTGGKGGDGLHVGDFTDLTTLITVQGSITASMGANGGRVDVRDTLVYGGINVTSANTTLQSVEFFNITESTVLGASTLKMEGAADATISFNDVTFQSALTISTGGGSDRVNFDTDEVETAIFSAFNTTVKINLGAGDDFFNAGTSTATPTVGNQFAGMELDGGAGADNAEFEDTPYQNTFLNPVVIKNVETKV